KADFRTLFLGRTSVREFSSMAVDPAVINEAVELALKAPSVCNRQSSRVLVIYDRSTIQKILALQGGFRGYETPNVLLVVTSDISIFVAPQERNQPYVDGGIFSMALLLALEFFSIAACPLNAMQSL